MASPRRSSTRSPVHRPVSRASHPPSEHRPTREIQGFGLFYRRQEVAIGLLESQTEGRWLVHTEDDGRLFLPEERLLYRWEAPTEKKTAGEPAPATLARLRRKLRKEARSLPVAELHATLAPGKAVTFAALAQKALPREGEALHPAVLFFALLQNHRLFRFSRGSFLPRSGEEISRRKAEEAERASEARWQRNAQQWQEALGAGRPRPKPPAPSAEFFRRLESLVACDRRSPFWELLAGPLGLRPGEPVENGARLKGLLEAAGQWRGWPRMWLLWGGVAQTFPPSLEKKAASLAARPVRSAGRTDFGNFPTFSFDPPGSEDFDDACSILAADSGSLQVAVHIAEPPDLLGPGEPLFGEAARRMASVYTLDGVFPMLPAALSAGRHSLKAGAEREVLTAIFRLREGAATFEGFERGLVRVTGNLDDAAGDALIFAKPETWGRLARLTAGLAAERLDRGAVPGDHRGVAIDRTEPARLRLVPSVRSGPSQQLVEELAILCNREAGRYFRHHRLPAIYRVQPAPRPTRAGKSGTGDEPGPAAARVWFSLRGAPHAGLACDRYVQVTAPLRRFLDLVMQRQIVSHLSGGGPAFPDTAQLHRWAEEAQRRLAVLREVERKIEDDWKRRYLAQNIGLELWGQVRGKTATVWLEEVMLPAEAELPGKVGRGSRGRFRVAAVDVDRHQVRVDFLQ